jgi:hypothetical protein
MRSSMAVGPESGRVLTPDSYVQIALIVSANAQGLVQTLRL